MNSTDNRVDASLFTAEERTLLQPIIDFAARTTQPCLKGADGTEIRLPEPLFNLLVGVVQNIRLGKAVVLMPESETFTTQAAANFLGMSRQYFVSLLESDQIPFHRVGSHRRVYFKDLLDYSKKRDAARRDSLGGLFKKVNDAGLYDASYTGTNAG